MTNGSGKSTALIPLSLLMLSACGGDGGGTASFASWSSIQPNSTVVANGLSQQVTSGIPSSVSLNSSVSMTFDANGALTELVFGTLDLDSFSSLSGGSLGFLDAASSTNLTTTAVIADPIILGYEFQTFGVWETESTSISTVGAFSVGAPTPASNIPTTDGVTFTGKLAGFYVDPGGFRYFAFGKVNMVANFVGPVQTLNFSTANTVIRPDLFTAGNEINASDLNLSGTLTYSPGTNSFTGDVTSAGSLVNPSLSGTSTGQFYGPSAQEVGGVFFLEGTGPETYSGAYGAAQP